MPTEKNGSIFLTGITGGLGSWFAAEALEAGTRIVALVRARNDDDARARVRATLEIAGANGLSDRVEVICGDLCAPDASADIEKQLPSHVSSIVHSAASTQFRDLEDDFTFQANVEGTRRILELAERRSLTLFHVSSAYVAGKRKGVVTEDETDAGQKFNNGYERTKFISEIEVRDWAQRAGLPVTILRPSIVMGDFRNGRTVKFNGIYDFLRVLDLVVPRYQGELVRLATGDNVTKNIITLDYFARAAWHIVHNDIRGCFHLTNPVPPTMRQLGEIFSRVFHFDTEDYRLVEPWEFVIRKPTPLEQIVLDAMMTYRHYVTLEPVFDRTHAVQALAGSGIELPALDDVYFRRLVEYGHTVKWGKLHRKA
ncbi:MAG: SDR family oxidoreductase [Planctomycetota bacterium]